MTRRGAAHSLPIAAVLLLLAGIGTPAPVRADGLVLGLPGGTTHPLDKAEIERLPPVNEHIAFLTGHGPEQADYTGGLLWAVLDQAGAIDHGERKRLNETLSVIGRDGYTVALALAEIDPDFEGKQVLLAYRKDGQPIGEGELRLVVPGDKRGGRSVKDVVRIEVH